jgi:hypothetical protein
MGLLPRQVKIPAWVGEGLAAYFESPLATGWSGAGSVDQLRLELYYAWEPDRELSSLDSVVSGQTSHFAASQNARIYGVGQAWALTHFLLEHHLEKCAEFYRKLRDLPPDLEPAPEVITALWEQVFGSDHRKWERLWRAHMKGLKPDHLRSGDAQ